MATESDLERLFLLQGETLSTEFKAWLDLSNAASRATLAKAAIALANHGGGSIIFGVEERKGAAVASAPRPESISRYTSDLVNAAINRFADPKIHCDVVHLLHPVSRNEHAIVVVPSGSTVPIMSIRELSGTIAAHQCYVRKPGPKSEQPFTAEEWRALLSRCVQAGREQMLDAIRTILQGHSLSPVAADQIDKLLSFTETSHSRWSEVIDALPKNDPARFLNGHYEQSFELRDVKPASGLNQLLERLRRAGEVRLTGWGPFIDLERPPVGPVPRGQIIEAWVGHPDEAGREGRHADFWRASPDGLLYEIRAMDEDFTDKAVPGSTFDISMPIWRIGETLLYVARLARLFAEDPEIAIRVRYKGLKGRQLKSLFDWRVPVFGRRTCHVEEAVLDGMANASRIETNLEEVLVTLLRPLYEAFEFYELDPKLVAHEVARYRQSRF